MQTIAIIRPARDRKIFTPEDYARVFAEGRAAYEKDGDQAVSPYLKLNGYLELYDQTQAEAWEQGWWSAAKEAVIAKHGETA